MAPPLHPALPSPPANCVTLTLPILFNGHLNRFAPHAPHTDLLIGMGQQLNYRNYAQVCERETTTIVYAN